MGAEFDAEDARAHMARAKPRIEVVVTDARSHAGDRLFVGDPRNPRDVADLAAIVVRAIAARDRAASGCGDPGVAGSRIECTFDPAYRAGCGRAVREAMARVGVPMPTTLVL